METTIEAALTAFLTNLFQELLILQGETVRKRAHPGSFTYRNLLGKPEQQQLAAQIAEALLAEAQTEGAKQINATVKNGEPDDDFRLLLLQIGVDKKHLQYQCFLPSFQLTVQFYPDAPTGILISTKDSKVRQRLADTGFADFLD